MAHSVRSPRWLLALVALVSFGVLSLAPAQAQPAATGTISGKVVNATNGVHLKNVVVTVDGTNRMAVTDDSGAYMITNVPAGEVTLKASYIGEADQTAAVTVAGGTQVSQDFTFRRSEATKFDKDGVVVLDPFVVSAERFKNAAAIAIAEERNSINIKNVISTDTFGEIPGGNVGEFIKYLPGVELEYGGTYIAPTDAYGVSVRGFGAEDTNIMIDGVPVTSASQASLTNQVGLDMLSINNASRVELIKVATPDMPMKSVGGQINLISKSAFEYARPSFTYNAYVVLNSEELNPFAKVVGATNDKVYAGQLGFDLSYIKPVNDRFGFSLSAARYSQYSANRRLRPEYGIANVNLDLRPLGGANNTPATNSAGPVSAENPFLNRVSLTDSPRTSISNSASMKLDWRPFTGLSVAANYQYSMYDSSDTDRRMQYRIQRPIDWGATYTHSQPYMTSAQSATGNTYNPSNSVDMSITSRDKSGTTHSGYLRTTYQKGPWDISALANYSRSRATFLDFENGHFSGLDVSANIGTLKFDDVVNGVPGKITAYDRTGLELSEFNYNQLSNWNNPGIQGKRGNAESADENTLYQFDLRRELDFLPWQAVRLAFKAGYRYEETNKEKWGLGTGYRETYNGTTLTAAELLDDAYEGTSPGWGFAPQQFASTYKLYDVYLANPSVFAPTANDEKENYWSMIGQTKALLEKNKAWYAQLEGRALNDRLRFVAGLRDETVTREGYGPRGDGRWNYLKNTDGSLYNNPALLGTTTGAVRIDQSTSKLFTNDAIGNALRADLNAKGIAYPTAAIDPNSLARARLERFTSPIQGKSAGDPNYSISMSYEVTKKLVAKLAYSVTSGRIKIEDSTNGLLSGNQNDFKVTQAEDPTAIPRGTISVANPNLLPESSQNWDFELAYYTDAGGKFSGSYYVKFIDNFTEKIVSFSGDPEFEATLLAAGFDPADYDGWELTTSVNGVGTGKASGLEFQASQDLRFLGALGRRIQFFATYSHSEREETNTTRISSRPSASNLATGGVSYSGNRFSLNVRGAWRDYVFNGDKATFTMADGTRVGIGEFVPSALKIDVIANYQLTKRTSIYVSARNILEEGNDKQRYDALGLYPAYARWDDYRETGVQFTMGVKGTF